MNIQYADFSDEYDNTLYKGFILVVDNLLDDDACARRLGMPINKYIELMTSLGAIQTRTGYMFLTEEQVTSAIVTIKLMK